MPDTIQFREISRNGEKDGVPRISDGDPNLLEADRDALNPAAVAS